MAAMAHADAILATIRSRDVVRLARRLDAETTTALLVRVDCPEYEHHRWSWGLRMRECTRCGRLET